MIKIVFILLISNIIYSSDKIMYLNPKKAMEVKKVEVDSYEIIDIKNIDTNNLFTAINSLNKNIKMTNFDDKIIVFGKKTDIEEMKKITNNLDVSKKEIEIKLDIIDTSSNLLDRIGVNWKFNTKQIINLISKDGIFGLFDAIDIDINALKQNGDLNYRSLPLIKVLDGKTASLKLTEETVFIENRRSKSATLREAGLILKVSPKITQKGIYVNIQIEISNFSDDITKKQNVVDTTIILEPNKKKLIASSKTEYTDSKVNKTPILSDLPLFGALFKYKNKSNIKRDVYIEIEAKINE